MTVASWPGGSGTKSTQVGQLGDIEHWDKFLVRSILENAQHFTWTMQDLGLLGLRLDEQRMHRLHVWAPERSVGPPVIHDHPLDFVSRIVAGELTNVRYVEDPVGPVFIRDRYAPGDEGRRATDTVRLVGTSETYREGDEYQQLIHELHESKQLPGTVTILRFTHREVSQLTVCRPPEAPWLSSRTRPATPDEVKEITSAALEWFSPSSRRSRADQAGANRIAPGVTMKG